MRVKWIATICLLVCVCLMGSCGKNGGEQRVVSVTIPPQQWLLQQIVGDRYKVTALLPPGANPETFEPDMQQLMDLQNSAAYFKAGMPGFEESMLGKMKDNFPDLPVYDSSEGVERLTGTHSQHDSHGDDHAADPHVWTSLKNARVMAANMLRHMVAIDPEGREIYTANFNRLDSRLAALDDSIAGVLAGRAGTSFIVWHPSLSYFARDYGLQQIAMEADGKEASVKQLRRQVDAAGAHRPVVFFLQQEYDSRGARTLAGEIGLPTASIAVMSADIADQARQITKVINEH